MGLRGDNRCQGGVRQQDNFLCMAAAHTQHVEGSTLSTGVLSMWLLPLISILRSGRRKTAAALTQQLAHGRRRQLEGTELLMVDGGSCGDGIVTTAIHQHHDDGGGRQPDVTDLGAAVRNQHPVKGGGRQMLPLIIILLREEGGRC